MALLIDLYQRYNTVTDWNGLSQAVSGAYIKFTDGLGDPPVKPDLYVTACTAHGIPYGGYAYAQPGDPSKQADVFVAAYKRLGGELAPALDLESGGIPTAERTSFARTFLERVKLAYPKVVLYASTSWLNDLDPDDWPYTWDRTWAAEYGTNDGNRQTIRHYSGRVDMHQYTSTGHISGVTGTVDLNWTDDPTQLHLNLQEDDLQPDEREALFRLYEQVCGEGAVPQDPAKRYPGWDTVLGKKTVVDILRELLATLRGMQDSRIADDTNKTNMADIAFDSAKWTFEDRQTLAALDTKLAQVLAKLEA